jgi:hypothetical protein
MLNSMTINLYPDHSAKPGPESQPSWRVQPRLPSRSIAAVRPMKAIREPYPARATYGSSIARNDIQWIIQRFNGGQWRNKSFHRSRLSLICRYGPLEIILSLPEHHDGFVEAIPRFKVCGRIRSKPTLGLPRHLFCSAMRKPLTQTMAEAA